MARWPLAHLSRWRVPRLSSGAENRGLAVIACFGLTKLLRWVRRDATGSVVGNDTVMRTLLVDTKEYIKHISFDTRGNAKRWKDGLVQSHALVMKSSSTLYIQTVWVVATDVSTSYIVFCVLLQAP